jgi:hypothetical protein
MTRQSRSDNATYRSRGFRRPALKEANEWTCAAAGPTWSLSTHTQNSQQKDQNSLYHRHFADDHCTSGAT